MFRIKHKCAQPAALLLPLLLLPPQVLVAMDKAADGSISQTQHGVINNRIAPLTAVYDDRVIDT
jgi:hypothetical protein